MTTLKGMVGKGSQPSGTPHNSERSKVSKTYKGLLTAILKPYAKGQLGEVAVVCPEER